MNGGVNRGWERVEKGGSEEARGRARGQEGDKEEVILHVQHPQY